MNGNNILLDTNIVLYLLSGDKTLSDLLFNKKLYVSFVTQLELLSYSDLEENEKVVIQEFLEDCIIIDINSRIKEEYQPIDPLVYQELIKNKAIASIKKRMKKIGIEPFELTEAIS